MSEHAHVAPWARRGVLIASGLLFTAGTFGSNIGPAWVDERPAVVLAMSARNRNLFGSVPYFNDNWLLYGLLGTYSGWTSMAFFVQIGTVVQGAGAPVDTTWGQTWQLLVLLAASGLAVAFVLGSRASIVYAATVTYALIGVGISAGAAGLTVLVVACVVGVTMVWASVVVIRAVDARHPSPTAPGSARPR